MSRLIAAWGSLVRLLTSEWVFRCFRLPNSGGVIVFRSFLSALLIFLIALSLRNIIDPARTWALGFEELRRQVVAGLPWYGAIFALFYTGLYGRYHAQWNYLANVYNQIKACEVQCAGSPPSALAEWKAGFLEDAEEVHLARKPIFVSVLRAWGREPAVMKSYVESAPGGAVHFARLMQSVEEVWEARDAQLR
jgi:hypothetical protein